MPGICRLPEALATPPPSMGSGEGSQSMVGTPQRASCRRLRQPEHKILQQLRSRRDNVYVVTEVLQTQEEVEVTQTRKKEGSGQFALPGGMCLQVCGQPTPSWPDMSAWWQQGWALPRPLQERLTAPHLIQSFPKPGLATTSGKPVPAPSPHHAPRPHT